MAAIVMKFHFKRHGGPLSPELVASWSWAQAPILMASFYEYAYSFRANAVIKRGGALMWREATRNVSGPRQPKRPNAYSEGEDEAPKLIETEIVDVEREIPETGNEPVEQVETDETEPPNFEE